MRRRTDLPPEVEYPLLEPEPFQFGALPGEFEEGGLVGAVGHNERLCGSRISDASEDQDNGRWAYLGGGRYH